jgi:hypothetical protein
MPHKLYILNILNNKQYIQSSLLSKMLDNRILIAQLRSYPQSPRSVSLENLILNFQQKRIFGNENDP